MQTRTAWIAAALAGGLAVLAVGIDLAMNLEARLETQRDGEWRLVASSSGEGYGGIEYRSGPFAGCAAPDLRLTVENGLPWAKDVRVQIVAHWFNGTSSQQQTLLDETWHLERGDVRQHAFTVPLGERSDGVKPNASVDVWIDDRALGTCVEVA